MYSRVFTGAVSDFGKVAVLYGGTSAERSVSLKSGQQIIDALSKAGVDVLAIDVGMQACDQLAAEKFDCAFIALHGGDGEGGKVQAFLELLGIPHTGSDYASSALALNKLLTKKVWLSSELRRNTEGLWI